MIKKKLFSTGTYDFSYWVLVGDDREAVKRFLDKRGGNSNLEVPDVRGACFSRDGGPSVIWLRYPPNNSERMGTLVHECTHCTFEVMRWAGVTLLPESEEAYTHLLAKMVRDTCKWLKKR